MYPNNQVLELFGEQIEWPGMGPDSKFTNGSFCDPDVQPSLIPAQTINLLLDNLAALIEKMRGRSECRRGRAACKHYHAFGNAEGTGHAGRERQGECRRSRGG
jgi:hypothetical protein